VKKSLKTKTINGLIWSFIDNFSVQLSQFIIGIILARILSPNDFGLIGMLTIFITISQWFVSSGFGQALIRKKDCNQNDYSTVFIFNIISGFVLYIVLFLTSGYISNFFNEPQLEALLNVLGISLIIIAFTIIQQTQLTKRLDFKLQTRISVISSIISGIIGVLLAYLGYGVWSLVYKSLLEYFIRSFLLWRYNKWRPSFIFDTNSFKELFGFGSKLMLRGLIYTIFNNLYYVVIGKYFSTADLGYYTRAEQFNRMPSSNINKVINRVSYPVLSELQNDDKALKAAYKKIFTSLVFISSISMLILGAIAEPLILTLIGEKWLPSVPILQLLCFVGLLYPLCDFNLTILKVKGKSGLILKLEIIKRILSIPVIIIGIMYGINALIIGMIVLSLFEFLINSYFSGKEISYTLKEQILNNLPSISVAFVVSSLIYYLSLRLELSNLLILFICLTLAMIMVVLISEIFKIKAYLNIKKTFF
jgi:teichuronic acid exporter